MSVDAASIAEYDWLQDTSARDDGRLHAPTEQIIDHYAYYWDHGEQYWETHDSGPALCGRDGWWTIPGVGARLTATRCPACCSLAGIPEGAGSPKNTPECRVLLGLETP